MVSSHKVPAVADLYGDLLETVPDVSYPLSAYFPGLAITVLASLAAAYLSEHYGAPLMLMGLLIGLAFNFANGDARLHPGLGFASKTLLRWGIVLVGLQITFGQIASLGWVALGAIVAMVAIVTLSGAAAARTIGRGAAFGTLAGGAVAICGASAALAIASVLGEKRASQAQLTLVLVAVSAASAVAMSLYPALAHSLHLSDKQAGFLMGASIHDVAQALGAGYSYSPEAGQTATIVKLTRVALLAPALTVVALAFPAEGETKRGLIGLPWFVLGFLILCAIHSLFIVPEPALVGAKSATTALLLLAVTATGIRSPMNLLLEQGWRASVPVIVATLISFGLALLAALMLV
ncbi:putative sulfate exporter family transporter [Sphingomonas paeninsulae]|uniref:Putative sulfate exporter family transporter n=1 Tax=Sphingomonas paeninsulae TaxID=2319844 RepID=A0A494TIT8_SPHPE|nr:putative sulfate exporter family transporter [Sphingomonas paeninsulae]